MSDVDCCKNCENFHVDFKTLIMRCNLNHDGVFAHNFNSEKNVTKWCPLKMKKGNSK